VTLKLNAVVKVNAFVCGEGKKGGRTGDNDEAAPVRYRIQPFITVQPRPLFWCGGVVAFDIRGKKGVEAFATDEAPRPDTTFEGLTKLRPAFRESGTITAGNASSISDGAAAVVVMAEDRAYALGFKPLARIAGYTTYGTEPAWFTTAPAKAIYKTRSPIAEFPNAWLKTKLNFTRFRSRGLLKASAEACWACLTHNLQRYFALRRLQVA